MSKENIAPLFNDKQVDDLIMIDSMTQQVRDLGGLLHFTIHKTEDGWMAQCNEVEGIITGGLNPNPTDFETEAQIREAIFTAFDIKTRHLSLSCK